MCASSVTLAIGGGSMRGSLDSTAVSKRAIEPGSESAQPPSPFVRPRCVALAIDRRRAEVSRIRAGRLDVTMLPGRQAHPDDLRLIGHPGRPASRPSYDRDMGRPPSSGSGQSRKVGGFRAGIEPSQGGCALPRLCYRRKNSLIVLVKSARTCDRIGTNGSKRGDGTTITRALGRI